MAIKYAILGLLSWRPFTGYDLKKVFVDSAVFYWSGNNNQIYRTLVQLLNEGLVGNQVQHQESLPSKKVYSITDEGRKALKSWVGLHPEAPELRNKFLIQLAWADQLNQEEIAALLAEYEEEIKMQLLMQQEKQRRGVVAPRRTRREEYLWEMVSANIVSHYQNELSWVHSLKDGLNNCSYTAEVITK